MNELDEIFATPTGKKRGCKRCGGENAVSLGIRMQKLTDKGQRYSGPGTTIQRGSSYCSACAIELWPRLLDLLDWQPTPATESEKET
jgi:hypothetical protein